jgi:membrane protein
VGFVDRIDAGWEAAARWLRRYRPIDRAFRAWCRYDEVHGGRLAAATAYFGFFAVFAFVAAAVAISTYLLRGNELFVRQVQAYLSRNLPQLRFATIASPSGRIGVLALVGMVIAGVSWVETLRSSQRLIWGLEQHPGMFVIRWLVDLAVLVGLGLLMVTSIVISSGLSGFLLELADRAHNDPLQTALRASGGLISAVLDLVIAAAVLAGVPRLRMSWRRLVPSVLLIGLGLWLLKTLGRWYVGRTQHNPAYIAVTGPVGVLLFMYLFGQLILFAAALAATARSGAVLDLATGRQVVRAEPGGTAAPAAVEPPCAGDAADAPAASDPRAAADDAAHARAPGDAPARAPAPAAADADADAPTPVGPASG